MSEPLPGLPDLCWPIESACCPDWDAYPAQVQQRAAALATSTLHALSGTRVGGCPVTVRPCRQGCVEMSVPRYGVGYDDVFRPAIAVSGQWVNLGCGCGVGNCSCTTVCQVSLPPPVGYVASVQIGSQQLPPDWYRVDDGNKLVWQGPSDLDCWPLCQDMTQPLGEPDTFSVSYLNAMPVDGLAAYAAGVLACEFAKACSGAKCRLPAGVVSVVRQGVGYSIRGAGFPDGRTGLIEVDAWLRVVNPNSVVAPSRVWSPDLSYGRTTTWASP